MDKTKTINGMAAVTKNELGMDYVQFLPDEPEANKVNPFHGMGYGQMLSNGSFDFVRKKRRRSRPEFRAVWSSLSFSANGYDYVVFKAPNELRIKLPTLLRKDVNKIINYLQKKGLSK